MKKKVEDIVANLQTQISEIAKVQKKCTTIDELKELTNNTDLKALQGLGQEEYIKTKKFTLEELKKRRKLTQEQYSELFKEIDSVTAENLKNFNDKLFNYLHKDKTLEQIIETLQKEQDALITTTKSTIKKSFAQEILKNNYDFNKKTFKNGIDEQVKSQIKKIINRIQGKYAAIYGSIGAAALGLATLLFKSKDS